MTQRPMYNARQPGWDWQSNPYVAGLIYVTTDNGTLVIDADDNEVEVVIRSGDGVRIIDAATGSTIKRLPTGEHVLDLKGDKNDFELTPQRFVLKRGSKVVASVTRMSRKPGSGDTTKNVQPMVAVRQVWHDSSDDSGDVAPDRRYVSFLKTCVKPVRPTTTNTCRNRQPRLLAIRWAA